MDMKQYNIKTSFIVLICTFVALVLLYFAIVLISNQNTSEDSDDNNNTPLSSGFIEIIDGDTFKMPDGEIVRLLCVDTPEKNQEGYDEATIFLTERLVYSGVDLNSDEGLRLEGNETDAYGRSLRWVYVDDVLINKEVIELGYGSLFEYGGEDCGRVK